MDRPDEPAGSSGYMGLRGVKHAEPHGENCRQRGKKNVTWREIIVLGLGDLELEPDEFWDMTLTRFMILLDAYQRKINDQWRHTRLIMSAMTGKDPRYLVPLPGDFDHVPKPKSFEERLKMARSLKMDKFLKLDEVEKRYRSKHGRD